MKMYRAKIKDARVIFHRSRKRQKYDQGSFLLRALKS